MGKVNIADPHVEACRDRQRPIDPNTGLPVAFQEPNTYTCENMMEAASMFEALGVGMDAQEMYGAMLQLKRLGEDPKLKLQHVRFFGKFFGLFKDYYIFEGIPRERAPPVAETEEGTQARLPRLARVGLPLHK